MNRFQLYELVKPRLHLMDLTSEYSLCTIAMYNSNTNYCADCIFNSSAAKEHCYLWLTNTSAQQLKADIIIKHPELLI